MQRTLRGNVEHRLGAVRIGWIIGFVLLALALGVGAPKIVRSLRGDSNAETAANRGRTLTTADRAAAGKTSGKSETVKNTADERGAARGGLVGLGAAGTTSKSLGGETLL